MSRKTLNEEMEELNAAFDDLRRELSRAFGFEAAARRHWLLPWIWAAMLILAFDVFVKITAAGLDALCGGPCL
jgi:hypothetical protein